MVSLRRIKQKRAMAEGLPRRRSERLQEQNLKNKNKISEVNSDEFEKLFEDELTDGTSKRAGSRKRGRKRKQSLDDSVKMSGTIDEGNHILDVDANPLYTKRGRRDEKRLNFLEQQHWTYQPTNDSLFQQALNNPSELVPVTNDFHYKESLMRFAKTAGPLAETVAEKYYERNKAIALHKQQQQWQQQQQQQQNLLQLQLQRQQQLLQQQHQQQQALLARKALQWQKPFPVVPPPSKPSPSSNTTLAGHSQQHNLVTTPLSQPHQSYLNMLDPSFNVTIPAWHSSATAPSNTPYGSTEISMNRNVNMNPHFSGVDNLMVRNFYSNVPPINTAVGFDCSGSGGQIPVQRLEGHNVRTGMHVATTEPQLMQHQATTGGNAVHGGGGGWEMDNVGVNLGKGMGNGSVPPPAPQQCATVSPKTRIFGVDVGSNRGLYFGASSSQDSIFKNN